MTTIFTADVPENELHRPPAPGCNCTYCRNMRLYGYAIHGEGSMCSHRLRGGDERHNPENIARLVLRNIVPAEHFAEYVSKPGGNILRFKGPSGIWYTAGRIMNYAGHYVSVHDFTGVTVTFTHLCIPPRDKSLPLASIVLSHYYGIQSNELNMWGVAKIETYFKRYIAHLNNNEGKYNRYASV